MKNPEDSGPDDQSVRDLMRMAGERSSIPGEDYAAIHAAARAVWQKKFAQPAKQTAGRRWLLPLAAAMVPAMVLTWWVATRSSGPRPNPVTVARVETVRGSVSLAVGQGLVSGSTVETSEQSWIGLRLAGGQSLRLDANSSLRLVSPTKVTLDRGAVYLDSSGGRPVAVRTILGEFVPSGTQFEVRHLGHDGVRLRVREGRVTLERKGTSVTAVSGDELVIREDGTLARAQNDPAGPSWDWILEAVRVPEIEGRTLRSFLDWMVRERGLKLEFEPADAAALGNEVILHGSVSGMTPEEALRTVTLSSGFSYQISDGKLIVRRQRR